MRKAQFERCSTMFMKVCIQISLKSPNSVLNVRGFETSIEQCPILGQGDPGRHGVESRQGVELHLAHSFTKSYRFSTKFADLDSY